MRRFRDTDLFEQIFQRILKACMEAGLVDESVVFVDSTHVNARANNKKYEDVVVEMGQQFSNKKFCAIAELNFGGDNSITVKKLVTFHDGHSGCDKQYGWGFNYSPGSKD